MTLIFSMSIFNLKKLDLFAYTAYHTLLVLHSYTSHVYVILILDI